MLTVRFSSVPDLLWGTPLLSSEIIRCQSDHGEYACSRGGVAVSGGDGMDYNTQVPVAKRVRVTVVMF
jgi:hypothetical protein